MDQFGSGNSGAMNMYGGGGPGYLPGPGGPILPYPAGQAPGPYGGTMQWGRGNAGGFNVANPGGGSDNIYGAAASGSGNMPGSNRVIAGRGSYGPGGALIPAGGCVGGPYPVADHRSPLGLMDATNVTNPALGENEGPVDMGASNISISNTATYLSKIAPRSGGEYVGRLCGGDLKTSEYDNMQASEPHKNERKNYCENCGNIVRQTGGMEYTNEKENDQK